MAADETKRPGFSLKRWSQRKLEAALAAPTRAEPQPTSAPVRSTSPSPAPPGAAATSPNSAPEPAGGAGAPARDLPPPESLTFDSDFTAFLQPKVDESLKRQALKKLFGDPRFNVMDGLDVYVDDYSKPDPLPPGMLEQLVQGRYLFAPPRTRVNEQGFVEDVPSGDAAADARPEPSSPVESARAPDEPSPATESPPVAPPPSPSEVDAAGDHAANPTPVSAALPRPEPTSR